MKQKLMIKTIEFPAICVSAVYEPGDGKLLKFKDAKKLALERLMEAKPKDCRVRYDEYKD